MYITDLLYQSADSAALSRRAAERHAVLAAVQRTAIPPPTAAPTAGAIGRRRPLAAWLRLRSHGWDG